MNSDLVFAIDLEMSTSKLLDVRTFVTNFVQSFTVGETFTRVGLLTFDVDGVFYVSTMKDNYNLQVRLSPK